MLLETSNPDTDQLLQEYPREGFVVVRGLFDARETLAWRDECERLLQLDIVDPDNLRTPFEKTSSTFPKADLPRAIEPVTDISPLFQKLASDERVLAPLRAIFEDEPMLFKDKLVFKAPGAGGYEMHQDQAWWQIGEPQNLVAVLIFIDAADEESGCIELFGGAHQRLLSTPGEWRNLTDEEVEKMDLSRGSKIVAQPGDVVILSSLAPHRSENNASDRPRRSLYFTYNAACDGALYSSYEAHYQDSLEESSVDASNDLFFR
jgi:hypothetical protein